MAAKAISAKELKRRKRQLPKKKRAKLEKKHPPQTRLFTLPSFPDPTEPSGVSTLTLFLESCEGEVHPHEAIVEFQDYWCEHPKRSFRVVETRGSLVEQNFSYTRMCRECGKTTVLQGRAPSWLLKQ